MSHSGHASVSPIAAIATAVRDASADRANTDQAFELDHTAPRIVINYYGTRGYLI